MKKVDDYIKEKMKKDPYFTSRYSWTMQKAAIAKKIIKYRIEHNLTQADLAGKLGITQQYISKIEEGDFTNLATAEKILYYMGYGVKLEIISLGKKHSKHLATYRSKRIKKTI